MTANVGGIDRILRIVAGLALIVLAATDVISSWGYLGVVLMATGLFSFCGAYALFGISTCAIKPSEEENVPSTHNQ